MASKRKRGDAGKPRSGWGLDPFGLIFSGPNHTKLPPPELLRLEVQLLARARKIGYAPAKAEPDGDAAPGVYGAAAYLALMRFWYRPEQRFFKHIFQRLVEEAQEAEDLGQFFRAFNPNMTCWKKTDEAGRWTGEWVVSPGNGFNVLWHGRITAVCHVEIFVWDMDNEYGLAVKKEEKKRKNHGRLRCCRHCRHCASPRTSSL